MLITVFTPTYNRAHLLPRLYESLCRQTFQDFEWIIVDDGSTDDTQEIVATFVGDNESFPQGGIRGGLRHFYQENGGKHRAINWGVKVAKGELFFIADSDDWLPDDALRIVADVYDGIKDDKSFAGICGLDGTLEGHIIGNGLPAETLDNTSITIRYKFGIKGDMKEVFRTDVLKRYPFPEIDGEKFCPEVLAWNRIAAKYKLRHFNKVIYLAEYQPNGISAGILKARMNSPVASMVTYQELNSYDIPFAQKVKAAINYWRFRLCSKKQTGIPKLPWWWNWTMLIGTMMHLRDLRTTN